MKKLLSGSLVLTLSCFASTTLKAEVIPFDSARWEFNPGAKVEEYLGKTALKLGHKPPDAPVSLGIATLKDMDFSNGIIEYDIAFGETRTFGGVKFHVQSPENYEKFYMRAHQSGNPDANQYMPIYNGVQSWQLYYGAPYATPVKYKFDEWMHVKLVVADKLVDIYLDDMEKPILTSELKREEMNGTVGLWGLNITGPVHFANFDVTPMEEAPAIKGEAKPEAAAGSGTVMNWSVSNTFDGKSLAGKTQLTDADTQGLEFTPLQAESTGMVNLARAHGHGKGRDTMFAKINVKADSAQTKSLQFGFSDAVNVYLNGQLLFSGNDPYESRDYRFLGTVGFYDTVYLPLQEGDNEILFAVTESPMVNGWGMQARFADMQGISLTE
ncbi:hypothetical protein [Thiothrix nivea]|uniref:3-keto-disaccharide hydrolase domain-containing protein n=1 Tax=Thiothrix nivea (strain ATCC 35100 / DSM 5205 / JP2) TaxID=870187 RepID=A0A656HIQ3_THINJ|nr:hypothetical protein [Thiothrix nivea]EIJ36871.1 hypothetical protein Thini_4391 [Thiothrix nivea DSM 5205]